MPRTEVAFSIAGTPGPQGSRTPGRRKDDTLFTRPSSKAGYAWMQLVTQEAALVKLQQGGTLPPPYEIELVFWFTKARTSKLRWPSDDLDKVVRATFDGFTHGALIEDDKYVIKHTAEKHFHDPRPQYGPGAQIKIIAGEEEKEHEAA